MSEVSVLPEKLFDPISKTVSEKCLNVGKTSVVSEKIFYYRHYRQFEGGNLTLENKHQKHIAALTDKTDSSDSKLFIMYKYQLESNQNTPTNSKRKYECPSCGKSKRFTLYIDIESKEYLNKKVGICDRSDNCGYHYSPAQYFSDNNITTREYIHVPSIKVVNKPPDFISPKTLESTLKLYSSNNLIAFLKATFDTHTIHKLISKYKIGTSKSFGGGSTVFWQIDNRGNVRGGKVILYNKKNGKRTNKITWVHSLMKLKEYNLSQCLFGEHLIKSNAKSIAVVESEKTALISSLYFPNYNWLASGSVQNLSLNKFEPLRGRNIILFPDASASGKAFELWKKRSLELNAQGFNCIVNDILEKSANQLEKEKGCDLADYLLKYPVSRFSKMDQQEILTERDMEIKRMVKTNPALSILIDEFNLS